MPEIQAAQQPVTQITVVQAACRRNCCAVNVRGSTHAGPVLSALAAE